MVHILLSFILFCVVLKLSWVALSLSAKFITVALYVGGVYLLADFFLKKPESYTRPQTVHLDDGNKP